MSEDALNLTRLVRIYPNAKSRKFILRNIAFSNEVWNLGIKTWERMYHQEPKYLAKVVFTPKKAGKKIIVTHRNYYRKSIVVKTKTKKDKAGKIISYRFTPVTRAHVPSGRSVRDAIVDQLQLTDWMSPVYTKEALFNTLIYDLNQAYQAFFDPARPDSKKPKIKHRVTSNGSYLDTQAHIKNGKVYFTANRQDKSYKSYRKGIRAGEDISDLNSRKRYSIRFIHRDNKFFVAISVKRPLLKLMPIGQDDAVDANVDHFNSTGYVLWLSRQKVYDHKKHKYVYKASRLKRLYDKVAHYQKTLANKRECVIKSFKKRHQRLDKSKWRTKNYQILQCKLRNAYLKITNIQHDLVQKYTTYLVKYHDRIFIEDLDVKHMKMGIASKGLHRSLFGYFRQVLTYKCRLYNRELVVVDKLFPSTQACPRCGMAKAGDNKITLKGNRKHHTPHEVFTCYYCGYTADRDVKVSPTLMRYNAESMKNIRQLQKQGQDYQILG